MRAQATAKFVGTSNRKIGLVAALIRGRMVEEAGAVLAATPKRATGPVGKVLDSAVANAENNLNLKRATLRVESVLVGAGPTLKRGRARAKGQSARIMKRSSHITVIVSDDQPITKAPVAAAQSATKVATKAKSTKETK